MYYPRVNRGISFTKPGIYSFCLILMIGLIAISTGINALYVFLSAGLGGFIVSGLLSELAIKSFCVETVSGVLADAHAPFDLGLRVKNSSGWFSIFQMRSYVFLAEPRFQLIAKPFAAEGVTSFAALGPRLNQTVFVTINGFPRGAYNQLKTVQVTTFPFGILEKFKLDRLESEIFVAPAINPDISMALKAYLKNSWLRPSEDQDFYGHRRYLASDGVKPIDWKRSAGKPPTKWVSRQFRAQADNELITIKADWAMLTTSPSQPHYEAMLERVRTLMKVLDESGKDYFLDLGFGAVARGSSQCCLILAKLPIYANRKNNLDITSKIPTSEIHHSQKVELTPDGFDFITSGERQSWVSAA